MLLFSAHMQCHVYAFILQEVKQRRPAAHQEGMTEGTCSAKPIVSWFELCMHPAAGSITVNACCNPPQLCDAACTLLAGG